MKNMLIWKSNCSKYITFISCGHIDKIQKTHEMDTCELMREQKVDKTASDQYRIQILSDILSEMGIFVGKKRIREILKSLHHYAGSQE